MIDLSDLLGDEEDVVVHPREIFLTLDRTKNFQFPRDIQTEVMRAWFCKRDRSDTIIKLNVGGGKTLLGLLLLQSCINEGYGPALYICPNKQLASQVSEEARDLGIDVTDDPSSVDFQTSQRICVTVVHTIFNGQSVFGVGEGGIKIKIGSVVVDDAHACLLTINEQFKITLQNTHPAYNKIFELLKDDLRKQAPARFLDLRESDPRAMIEVPFWAWQGKQNDILEALHAEREEKELVFTYPLLQDILPLCRCFVGGGKLEIEPTFPPSDIIKSFAKAKRRIYMTATLSDDSVLATHFSINSKNLTSPIVPSSLQSMGERMILVPQDINADLRFLDIQQLLVSFAKEHNVVVIVPSSKTASLWKDCADQILTKNNISSGIDKLHEGHVGLTVLVNRYDGIDLPGEACRVLAIFDLPEVMSFREKADYVVLSETDVTLRHQIQRIEQGMGRGVRSNDDHCVVFLCGTKLTQRIKLPEGKAMLTPATRAQMDLSARIARRFAGATVEQLQDIAKQCLDRDRAWIKISKQALLKIKSDEELNLDASLINVRLAFDLARRDDPIAAEEVLLDTINKVTDSDMKAWLMVRQAEIKHVLDAAEAQKILASANKMNSSVLKPIKGADFQKLSPPENQQAARVQCIHREHFDDAAQRVVRAREISEDLVFDPDMTDKFESALDMLGQFIGLNVQRPEKEMNVGPDNLWAFYEEHYFVIEVKSGVTSEQGISKNDFGQLGQSISWFKKQYPHVDSVTPVMVHPLQKPGQAATPVEGMRIITEPHLDRLKKSFTDFCASLGEENILGNVRRIANLLKTHNFTKGTFLDAYTTKPKLRG